MNKEQEAVKKFAERIIEAINHETFKKGCELKKVERRIKEIAKDYYGVIVVTEQKEG